MCVFFLTSNLFYFPLVHQCKLHMYISNDFQMSGADKMKKVQRALIDYLIEKKGDADVSVEVNGLFSFFFTSVSFLFSSSFEVHASFNTKKHVLFLCLWAESVVICLYLLCPSLEREFSLFHVYMVYSNYQ